MKFNIDELQTSLEEMVVGKYQSPSGLYCHSTGCLERPVDGTHCILHSSLFNEAQALWERDKEDKELNETLNDIFPQNEQEEMRVKDEYYARKYND